MKTFRIPGVSHPAHPAAIGTAAVAAADDAWASGFSTATSGVKQPLMLHWNGSSWRRVATPTGGARVGWVAARGSEVWAVGSSSAGALTMHWKAGKWAVVPNPGGSGSSLTDVTIVSPTDVWAVGVARSGPLALHWDGKEWSKVAGPGFGQGSYMAVAGIPGTSQVWIYGNDEASYGVAAARGDTTGWQRFELPVKGSGWSLTSRSLVADSDSSAWIAMTVNDDAGKNRPFALHWNGSTWSATKVPNPGGNASLTGIAASKADDVWAVGRYQMSGSPVKSRSFVLHWDGSAWKTVAGPSQTSIVRPGKPVGLAGVAATPDTGPVWAIGLTLDEYHC
jgi:hypothetical protein